MKKHLATFAALALLSITSFVSCEKAKPDNSGTQKQDNTETPQKSETENSQGQGKTDQEQETHTDSGKTLIVYYSYTGNCGEIVTALSSNLWLELISGKQNNQQS